LLIGARTIYYIYEHTGIEGFLSLELCYVTYLLDIYLFYASRKNEKFSKTLLSVLLFTVFGPFLSFIIIDVINKPIAIFFYLTTHASSIFTVMYFISIRNYRLKKDAMEKSIYIMFFYFFIILIINKILNTNFLLLSIPPGDDDTVELFYSVLGKYYQFALVGMGIILFTMNKIIYNIYVFIKDKDKILD